MRAIDFGTSSTAAARLGGDGTPELVTFGGSYAFPSTVAIDRGEVLCGEEAELLLPADPAAGTRAPKLVLANDPRGVCPLGGESVEVGRVITAILREAMVGDAGREDGPRSLTHPADWEPEGARCAILVEAAEAAGLGRPLLVSEPVAVAWHLVDRIKPDSEFCVFDLGGGTCDMAALQRTATGFVVMARPRSEPIGGELMDMLLFDLVIEHLEWERPAEAAALRAAARLRSDGVAPDEIEPAELGRWQRCVLAAAQAVRAAKVRLSREDEATVRILEPVGARVRIGRDELAARARPPLERAADALSSVMAEAGLDPEETTVKLSGGASVVPVVREVLAERTGARIEPVTPAKGAVALGALRALQAHEKASASAAALGAGCLHILPTPVPCAVIDACLTPDGGLALGGVGKVAVVSKRGEVSEDDVYGAISTPPAQPWSVACAPDGTLAVATSEGVLYTTQPKVFGAGLNWRRDVLIKEKTFGRNWLMSALAFEPGTGGWIVGRRNNTIVVIGPDRTERPLPARAAAAITHMPIRIVSLAGRAGFAALMVSRLVIVDEDVTVVEAGESRFCDMAVGADGVLAAAHLDGTIDLIAAGAPGREIGSVLDTVTTLTVSDDDDDEEPAPTPDPRVAVADGLIVAAVCADLGARDSSGDSVQGTRIYVLDPSGRALASGAIEGLEPDQILVDALNGIAWILAVERDREGHRHGSQVCRIPWPPTGLTSAAGVPSDSSGLQLLSGVGLPFEPWSACLTPTGALAIGGTTSVAVVSESGEVWIRSIPKASLRPGPHAYGISSAPDGTIAIATTHSELHTFGAGGEPHTLLIKDTHAPPPKPTGLRGWLSPPDLYHKHADDDFSELDYRPERGDWVIACSDLSILTAKPSGEVVAVPTGDGWPLRLDPEDDESEPRRLVCLPGREGFAVVSWKRIAFFDEHIITVREADESGFFDMAVEPGGLLALAHGDGTVDIIAAAVSGLDVGSLITTFSVPLPEDTPPLVALTAQRLVVATWRGSRAWILDLTGRVLAEADLATDVRRLLAHPETGTLWVVGPKDALRYQLPR